jgi:hypothetical protein
MKKFVLAAACAVALLGLAHQRASAWCNFTFGAGVNLGFKCGGQSCGPQLPPCCIDPCLGGMIGYSPVEDSPVGPQPQAYPVVDGGSPFLPEASQPAGFQPVGFSAGQDYSGYAQDPTQYQAPYYWYGR